MYSIVGWQVLVRSQHLWHNMLTQASNDIPSYRKAQNPMQSGSFPLQPVHFCVLSPALENVGSTFVPVGRAGSHTTDFWNIKKPFKESNMRIYLFFRVEFQNKVENILESEVLEKHLSCRNEKNKDIPLIYFIILWALILRALLYCLNTINTFFLLILFLPTEFNTLLLSDFNHI